MTVTLCTEDPLRRASSCVTIDESNGVFSAGAPPEVALPPVDSFSLGPPNSSGTPPSPPSGDPLERRTKEIGRQLLVEATRYKDEVKETWFQRLVMNFIARDPERLRQILFLTSAFPTIENDPAVVADHVYQYVVENDPVLHTMDRFLGHPTGYLKGLITKMVRAQIVSMGRRFIPGENLTGASPELDRLARHRIYATVDLLGEASLSDDEANRQVTAYEEMIKALGQKYAGRPRTTGGKLLAEVSIKLTALEPHLDPLDREGSYQRVAPRLTKIFEACMENGVAITIDLEQYDIAELSYYIFMKVLSQPRFREFRDAAIVIQAYLKDAENYLNRLEGWVQRPVNKVDDWDLPGRGGTPIGIRLVKGANWDFETSISAQNGWDYPVFVNKWETDANWEHLARRLIANWRFLRPDLGSHNVRSLARGMAIAERLGVPKEAIDFEMLAGMEGDILRAAVEGRGYNGRFYTPVGPLIPGMAYFVRRVLENSSNSGFVQSRRSRPDPEILLRSPTEVAALAAASQGVNQPLGESPLGEAPFADGPFGPFRPEPLLDFRQASVREEFERVVASARQKEIGSVPDSTPEVVNHAITMAAAAATGWNRTPPMTRAEVILGFARLLRRDRNRLTALVMTSGKIRREADADIAEAIDFAEWYARLLMEVDTDIYRGGGVGAVISPWNFASIGLGMTLQEVAAGNAAVWKPSERSTAPIIAAEFVGLMREAGFPPGLVNLVFGAGDLGELLVNDPRVTSTAFTGSKAVGLSLYERAVTQPYLPSFGSSRRAVTEMGGRNGIIISKDADMDDAVRGFVQSMTGHAGQKCSACSVVIIHEDRYAEFMARVVPALRSLKVGDPFDSGTEVPPLIDERARRTIDENQLGPARERLRDTAEFYSHGGPMEGNGAYVSPTLIVQPPPSDPVLREEMFGPIASVLTFSDFDEALRLLNDTEFGLTAGLYSRNPREIRRFTVEARAGNLYINRRITGARVGIEPFGGFGMSGTGPKAGGPDSLTPFMRVRPERRPERAKRSYTSNTMIPVELAQRSDSLRRRLVTDVSPDFNGIIERAEISQAAEFRWETRENSLNRLAAYVAGHEDELVALLATEYGIGYLDAQEEAVGAATVIRQMTVSAARLVEPQPTSFNPGERTELRYRPRGVGLVIGSDHTPLPSLAALLSGALAVGNSLILTSTEKGDRLVARWFADAARRFGLPVQFHAPSAGSAAQLAMHPRLGFVAYDGTPEEGTAVLRETVRNLPVRGAHGIPAFIGTPFATVPEADDFVRRFALEITVSENLMSHGANLGRRELPVPNKGGPTPPRGLTPSIPTAALNSPDGNSLTAQPGLEALLERGGYPLPPSESPVGLREAVIDRMMEGRGDPALPLPATWPVTERSLLPKVIP
ncbi:MAG: bifunctional proline dehydrogenase/L-glutamate gamma-semialdehyde dehydrogenase [Deltaproteobacteria bacterium]|nr:bifunctional proline dehydrogenase/L-glutamate gamma-semialdehyde dehydrogenase [Deltaproteobacteria bacterium]